MRTHHLFLVLFCGFLILSCSPEHSNIENILIKGSDTEVNLALSLAETYMAKDPNISIAVTGGGSGAGIAALINGKTEIANSSREMKEEEIELANKRGVEPMPIVFAVDALALAVNKDSKIDSITIEQLGAIFRGEITNWKDLGGDDMKISLYGRQSNSGTFVYFRDNILKADYSRDLKQMNGTAQMVEGIKSDPAGIGYVGVGYVVQEDGSVIEGVKILKVKETAEAQAFSPAISENITNGDYPIVRPLFQYTNGHPQGKLRDFVLYCLGVEGQKIVQDNGFYPVSKKYWAQNEKILNFSYADTLPR
ncbi:MAG: PstS family phosphate ABC transporter substrate-binding protein [Saprospiraceae bacterium]|nr:PstS family phosphate ABC transporter substrate-binding protein [Saprospiraceae bacterium]